MDRFHYPVSFEELLAIPEDGMDRWLIRGEVRQRRHRFHEARHAQFTARLSQLLGQWVDDSNPAWMEDLWRGEVYSGTVGLLLERNPDTYLTVDVAYLSSSFPSHGEAESEWLQRPPTFATIVMEGRENESMLTEKIEFLKDCGTLLWCVDLARETVDFHRPYHSVTSFDSTQMISVEPQLPGFTIPVARLFRR